MCWPGRCILLCSTWEHAVAVWRVGLCLWHVGLCLWRVGLGLWHRAARNRAHQGKCLQHKSEQLLVWQVVVCSFQAWLSGALGSMQGSISFGQILVLQFIARTEAAQSWLP